MKTAFVVIYLAASAIAQNFNTAAPVQASCGPTQTEFQIKLQNQAEMQPALDGGNALVYVVEEERFKYVREVTVRIGADGAWVGATRGTSHLAFSLAPGVHHLCVDWMPQDASRQISLFGFTAEAGKVYYFRARISGGPASSFDPHALDFGSAIDLDPVNEDEGKMLVAISPYSVSHAKK